MINLLLIPISLIIIMTGCAAMPELFKAVDDIATDDCITIKVDKDAFQKETDVAIKLTIDVMNKDEPR